MSDHNLLIHSVSRLKNAPKMKMQELRNQWVCYLGAPNLDIGIDKGYKICDFFQGKRPSINIMQFEHV